MRSQEVLRKLEIHPCLNGRDVRTHPLLGDNADGVGVLNTNPEIHGKYVEYLQCVYAKTRISLAIEVIRVATGAQLRKLKKLVAE